MQRLTTFQHTAARRRLQPKSGIIFLPTLVSTHSRPKAAAAHRPPTYHQTSVSTHSRPKAAAKQLKRRIFSQNSFNTQPPEGGCCRQILRLSILWVSTHSRPKAAAKIPGQEWKKLEKFQHTAARRRLPFFLANSSHRFCVSTHSRPKAAANLIVFSVIIIRVSTHSRPKAAA